MRITELVEAYRKWAADYYRPQNPRKTRSTYNGIRAATKLFLEAASPDTPVDAVTCAMLYDFQQMLAERQYARGSINLRVAWIQRMYRWAAHPARSMVPEDVAAKLSMLPALPAFRAGAYEPEPVEAVPLSVVEQTMLYCSQKIRTMVAVQWWTGMRPSEVCDMRWSWIEQTDTAWIYRPKEHKTAWRRLRMSIPLGPNAISALRRWQPKQKLPDIIFHGTLGRPMRESSYGAAIRTANRKHGLTDWFPHMIRHSYAERVALAAEQGEDDARIMLNHTSVQMTRRYIGIDPALPRKLELARRFG